MRARLDRLRKLGLFVLSLLVFTLALYLMKTGARELAPLVTGLFRVTNPMGALGFGWLFAYAMLSGSPVAAAALAFLDAGALNPPSTFGMITGSRIGASLIVLLFGFMYVLRGHERTSSLTMGLLSLTITGSSYIVALPLGLFLLGSGAFNALVPETGATPEGFLDRLVAPMVNLAVRLAPTWGVFLIGLGLVILSFNLFDKALPEITLDRDSVFGGVARLPYRPIVIFLLGLAMTSLTMSVSVSLSILVPLSARGYVRRENAIPYIMGCNVSTFVDTLLASILIKNPMAFTVVLMQMLSMVIVSVVVLLFLIRPYARITLAFVDRLLERQHLLVGFLLIIFLVPLGLVFLAH